MKLCDFRYKVDYTWVKTKNDSSKEYDINDPKQRKLYFASKIGEETEKLKEYMSKNSFIAYLIAPKMAGKSTYTGLLEEILGPDSFEHVIVGDLVRNAHSEYEKKGKQSDIYLYAEDNYRGMMDIDEAFDALVGRSTSTLCPTEIIIAIIKKRIDELDRKTMLLDGFPRDMDQIAYSLYFRDLIDHREDPDLFVLINIPIAVINARLQSRQYCPECKLSRSIELLPTSDIRYDTKEDQFYMVCDNPGCSKVRLISKEGDNLGIKGIEDRICKDLELMDRARKMYGIPKVEIYNSILEEDYLDWVDEYEITKRYSYEKDKAGNIKRNEKRFVFEENGKKYVSVLAATGVTQFVKQLADLFC